MMESNMNEVLDLSKENIQPLRQGRKVFQLRTALQAHHDPDIQQMLMKQRNDLEYKIRMYEGDDPLEPYHNYVIWLEQNYPNINRDSNYTPLLEDILVKFKDCPKYKQDPRLIQILVKYISTQENPLELYQLVYHQGLGTMCSLFYKRWAEELDNVNDFKRADKVFQLGISCHAMPIKDLEDAHVQFQLSIARRMLEGKINASTETNGTSARTILSKLSVRGTQSSRYSKQSAGVLPSQNRISRGGNFDQNNFKVYEEDVEDKGVIKNQNLDLPKSEFTNRENKLEAGKWCGIKQRQSCLPRKPTKPQFEIHEDTEVVCTTVKNVERPQVLRTRTQFKCPIAIFEPPDPTKKTMYPKHLVYVGNRDVQLEEIKAAQYFKLENERRIVPTEELVDEPMNLTKSSSSSLESRQAIGQLSPVRQPTLKRTYSDSNLTGCVVNTDMSTRDQSWYLKTEFIQPVQPPHAIEPVITSKTNYVVKNDQKWSLNTEYIQPVKLTQTSEVTSMRKFPSESRLFEELTSLNQKSEFNAKQESTSTFQIAHKEQDKDELLDFNNHLSKANASIFHHSPSASFTVNTRAAMNVIQKMWESPLAPRSAKITKTDDENQLFKMPVAGARKSECFKMHSSFVSESDLPIQDRGETGKSHLPFSVFRDESIRASDVIQRTENKLVFPVYCEDNETKPEIDIYARLSTRTNSRKIVESCDQLSSSMCSLKIDKEEQIKSKPTSEPLIIPVKLQDTPKLPENKENDPPESDFIAGDRKPHILVGIPNMPAYDSNDDENELLDDTCSTKAFAMPLPSSTPFSRPDRSYKSRKSSIFNGSYTEDNAGTVPPNEPDFSNASTVNTCRNPTNLSLILENSKEHGYSSSGGNAPKSLC